MLLRETQLTYLSVSTPVEARMTGMPRSIASSTAPTRAASLAGSTNRRFTFWATSPSMSVICCAGFQKHAVTLKALKSFAYLSSIP